MNNTSTAGRTLFLFLSLLGVAGAVGFFVMRSSAGAASEPVPEPVAEAGGKGAPLAQDEAEKQEEPEKKAGPAVKKTRTVKKKVIRWEGGAESAEAARREGMKVWAGPASQAPGRFGSGAAPAPSGSKR